MFLFRNETDVINNIINKGAENSISELKFYEYEIFKFKSSPVRRSMITAERYYKGEHDILRRRRTVIGEGGKLSEVDNLPNNRLIDNQYAMLVDQKNNYLFSKPFTIMSENKEYAELLNEVFDRKFFRLLKSLGEDAINFGIAWLYVYFDEDGKLAFKRFKPYEVIPFWKDEEHTILDSAVRIYEVEAYEGDKPVIIEKAEIYNDKGVSYYVIQNGHLVPDVERNQCNYVTNDESSNSNYVTSNYISNSNYVSNGIKSNINTVTKNVSNSYSVTENTKKHINSVINKENSNSNYVTNEEINHSNYVTDEYGNSYNFEKLPLIAFKCNNKEIPLINRVKSLQDALNTVRSDFMNNIQEDCRNTILVLKNYDGTNLGEFRKNLSEFGVVKVKSVDGADGGVSALKVDVDSSNYKTICEMLKKAIIENGRGFDAKSDRLSGNPNQMNIQSMYSEIDLDANGMEGEFLASFDYLLWFIDVYIESQGLGSFSEIYPEIIFNRDILINESESINNCSKSIGIISKETIIGNHPWIKNADKEISKINKEKKSEARIEILKGGDSNENNRTV